MNLIKVYFACIEILREKYGIMLKMECSSTVDSAIGVHGTVSCQSLCSVDDFGNLFTIKDLMIICCFLKKLNKASYLKVKLHFVTLNSFFEVT